MRFLQRFVAARYAWQLSDPFRCLDPAMRPRVGPQLVKSLCWAIVASQTGGAASHPRRTQSNLEVSIAGSTLRAFAFELA